MRADGAGNARAAGELDSAPVRRLDRAGRGADRRTPRGRPIPARRLRAARHPAGPGRLCGVHLRHDGRTQGRHRNSRRGGRLRRRSPGPGVTPGGGRAGPPVAHRPRLVLRLRRRLAAAGCIARRPRRARRRRSHPDRRGGAGRADRRARRRHDRHHPVDVRPAAGLRPAERGAADRAGVGGRGARQRGLGPNPQRVQHHNDVGVQLLRPDRDHRRGGGGRHRRTRRAVHRAAHPAHPRLRAGLRVAPGAVRGDRRAVPGRRPAGPRLSGPRGGDRLPVRRRPVRGLRTDVSNRGPGAPVARRLTAIRGTRRRPGEDPRPPRGARRDRGRAGIAPRRASGETPIPSAPGCRATWCRSASSWSTKSR